MFSPSTTKPTVLVTGASGFLGSEIVYQLLEAGYIVHGTARGAKVAVTKAAYAQHPNLKVFNIPDVATSDFSLALEGVTAVMHTASPLMGAAEPEVVFTSAIDGSLNLLRQAEKAGIKRFVVTSTFATIGDELTNGSWRSMSREFALSEDGNSIMVYVAAKILAERAVWKFADEHPSIDMTVLNPPWIFGKFNPNFPLPTPDWRALSTNNFIHALIRKDNKENFTPSQGYIDVRDIALAHIRALHSPTDVGQKRIMFISPHELDYKVALQLIAEKRPELRGRLADSGFTPVFDSYRIPYDMKRVEEVLGIKAGDFHSMEETILDTVDQWVVFEEDCVRKGFSVEPPTDLYL